MMHVQKNIK